MYFPITQKLKHSMYRSESREVVENSSIYSSPLKCEKKEGWVERRLTAYLSSDYDLDTDSDPDLAFSARPLAVVKFFFIA